MSAYRNAQSLHDTVDEPRTTTQYTDFAPLLAAFRALGKAVEPGPAFQRTRAWYRGGRSAARR